MEFIGSLLYFWSITEGKLLYNNLNFRILMDIEYALFIVPQIFF